MIGNAMPFREELEKRKTHHDAEAAKDQAAREKRDAACVKRAEELVVHLQQEDSSSIGLEIEWENSQVRLRGEKFDIIIDVDVDDYSAFISAPSKNGRAPSIPCWASSIRGLRSRNSTSSSSTPSKPCKFRRIEVVAASRVRCFIEGTAQEGRRGVAP
jgi:hypothetical protein